MFEIIRLGERTVHDHTFFVDRPKGHPFYLLLLLHTPGRFWINGEWKDVTEDTAFVFKPEQRHLYGPVVNAESAAGYTDSWIHIDSNIPLLKGHFPYGEPISLHQPSEYHSLFHLLAMEFFGTSGNREETMRYLLSALLCKLDNEVELKEYPDIYYDLRTLRGQIFSKPDMDWRVDQMAKYLNISEGYLHASYKKYFGTSCMNDVICARIEYACEYLTSTNKSVEEVAELCGYHHTEHFIRQFKKKMNKTPLQYKKQQLDLQ